MNRYRALSSLFCLLLLRVLPDANAAEASPAEIVVGPEAAQIGNISGETLELVSGSTYLFTVDTPEDKGLITTRPDVKALLRQIASSDGSAQIYRVTNKDGAEKTEGTIEAGDHLVVTSQDGKANKTYQLQPKPLALSGKLHLTQPALTAGTSRELELDFTAGQRSPDATVRIFLPAGVHATMDNTTVNVIGRGAAKLGDLPAQSIGRVGGKYSYSKVGVVSIGKSEDGGSVLTFSHLDLRPANGADLKIVISGVKLAKAGKYSFKANYTTSAPEVLTSAGIGGETASLDVVETISDFTRVVDRGPYLETPDRYTSVQFKWTPAESGGKAVQLMQSIDEGKSWTRTSAKIDAKSGTASIAGLEPNKLHTFKLEVDAGKNKGASNAVQFYSGKLDLKSLGATGDGKQDDTDTINAAILYLARIGGGTLLFSDGTYNVRTVHLQSNVYLYVDKGATISALKGADAPEPTWFSDRKYRSGLSPTDAGPYENPENWLTKQDVGHHYFRNSMFFGERLDNVKIVGNGRITGANNIVTSDGVMKNAPESRGDKMFTLKLCTDLEIGGLHRDEDLWYDPEKDEPYYIGKDGSKIYDVGNTLQIDRTGHFALLLTGTDGINVHDTCFARIVTGNVRDVCDFMACNDVTVTNIYSKLSSDDIVKPGSDCSLGFTRPAKGCRVRNIIGDTNCNLFQIGSETADDITDLHVDNIYVLGANKAGFSISSNDGGHVRNVYLNTGYTGSLHSRSKMLRTHTPFFISISNRGRILGATVSRYKFDENGKAHDELLNTNVDIGVVENIVLNGIDVTEMYSGSAFRGKWKPYDGTQAKQAPIVAGYKLPDSAEVQGGLNFKLPNGKHTGYVQNIRFSDVHFLAKGGNPQTDSHREPQELGVGQYNASNLGVLPTYGFYARHVMGLTLDNCSFNYEKTDHTYPLFLDDVAGAKIAAVKLVRAADAGDAVKLKGSRNVTIESAIVYADTWGNAPTELPAGELK